MSDEFKLVPDDAVVRLCLRVDQREPEQRLIDTEIRQCSSCGCDVWYRTDQVPPIPETHLLCNSCFWLNYAAAVAKGDEPTAIHLPSDVSKLWEVEFGDGTYCYPRGDSKEEAITAAREAFPYLEIVAVSSFAGLM